MKYFSSGAASVAPMLSLAALSLAGAAAAQTPLSPSGAIKSSGTAHG